MERSEIRVTMRGGEAAPHSASLHAGYELHDLAKRANSFTTRW